MGLLPGAPPRAVGTRKRRAIREDLDRPRERTADRGALSGGDRLSLHAAGDFAGIRHSSLVPRFPAAVTSRRPPSFSARDRMLRRPWSGPSDEPLKPRP